jgi:hypothetical protein
MLALGLEFTSSAPGTWQHGALRIRVERQPGRSSNRPWYTASSEGLTAGGTSEAYAIEALLRGVAALAAHMPPLPRTQASYGLSTPDILPVR